MNSNNTISIIGGSSNNGDSSHSRGSTGNINGNGNGNGNSNNNSNVSNHTSSNSISNSINNNHKYYATSNNANTSGKNTYFCPFN